MAGLGPREIIILVIVVALVFGWKKLPDAARSLGRSLRIFKSEVDELKKDGDKKEAAAPQQLPTSTGEAAPTIQDAVQKDQQA